MRRFAFSSLVFGVLVACGGAGSTDLFSGDGTGGGGSSVDGSADNADGSGGGPGNSDGGGGGGGNSDGGGGGAVDSGTPGKDSGTGTACVVTGGGTSTTCAMDEVCLSTNCMTGTCQKIVSGSSDYSPVCGCDSVNYWNAATASLFVAAVKAAGVCPSPALCNSAPAGNAKCSALQAADCAFEKPDLAGNACGVSVKNPTCWGMPNDCPAKPTLGVSLCGNGNCADLCSTIKSQTSYRVTIPACKIN